MGIAITLAQYLVNGGIEFELVPHPHAQTASQCRSEPGACRKRRQSGRTQGGSGFMLAVLPASRHIQFDELRRLLGNEVDIANEEQVERFSSIANRVQCPRLAPHTVSRSLWTTV